MAGSLAGDYRKVVGRNMTIFVEWDEDVERITGFTMGLLTEGGVIESFFVKHDGDETWRHLEGIVLGALIRGGVVVNVALGASALWVREYRTYAESQLYGAQRRKSGDSLW